MTVLINIIVFLLCLSFVVCIHELGHLLVAKICGVYCFEYSIGFGPKIFGRRFKHKNRWKNGKPLYIAPNDSIPMKYEGETQFSIRALPLGGYVSMAGDDDSNETPDGKIVPTERTLNGINRAKQICIMLAGIAMNFILAYILFYCNFAFCTQQRQLIASNQVTIAESTKDQKYAAYEAGLRTGDQIVSAYQEYQGLIVAGDELNTKNYFYPYDPAEPVDPSISEITSYQKFKTENATTYDDLDPSCLQYHVLDIFSEREKKTLTLPAALDNVYPGPNSKRVFHLTVKTAAGETKDVITAPLSTVEEKKGEGVIYRFEALGVSPMIEKFKYGAGEAFSIAGGAFSDLFVGIYKSIGMLFTPEGWQNVGGIISVYKMSAQGMQSGSVGYFLLLWGYISLNLGCFNLLPIPGLDGWQTMICLIEATIRRKLPQRGKSIANMVGMIVMLVLAGLLIIKDLII